MGNDAALFRRAWLRAPLQIAALSPSSPALARACAAAAGLDGSDPGTDPVLELGAGTGAITKGLVAAGVTEERLILLECEAELADVLRRQCPKARVIDGDAGQIGWWLSHLGVVRLKAVVSTLPILWFPANLQRAILAQCFRHLPAEGRFVQVTNRPASPVPHLRFGYRGERAAWVWRNLPPSAVWRYWRDSG